jgi:hypothetical protein
MRGVPNGQLRITVGGSRADRRRFASIAGNRMAGERAMETELKFKLKAGQGAQA